MITLLLILLPLLSALAVLIGNPASAKKTALFLATAELILASYAFFLLYLQPQSAAIIFSAPWITSLGIRFSLNLDGISMVLVLLTSMLTPLIILSSFGAAYKNPRAFYALVLFMQMALTGVFMAADGFLFYIFWELALIPVYFICLIWGGDDRARITLRFFIYTLTGSLFMLLGLIFLYQHTAVLNGGHSFDINALYKAGQALNEKGQTFVFFCIFLAFAVKMPLFPFHSWQPDTYTNAPAQGTMLLSGIMLKMGTYGLLRWLMPVVPLATSQWGPTAITLAVIGLLYASCIAIVQKDFKRLIAYSSMAHVGLIAAGIMAFNTQGLQGAMLQMFSHGINVVGLFFIIDIISTRTGTFEINKLGGIRNVAPQFAAVFLIVLLASVALPLTNGFPGEFLLFSGIFRFNPWVAAIAGLSVILGAVYMLRSYQTIMLGETNSLTASFSDLSLEEKSVLIPIVLIIIVLGIYPKILLDITAPAIQQLLSNVHL